MAMCSSFAVNERPDIVIGSGPSGVAAATALIARGRPVLMIDGGRRLDPGQEKRRAEMAASPPETWSDAQRHAWTAPQFRTPAGQTRRFGSDHAMEPAQATVADPPAAFGLRASRAVGGLSNLWGAAMLPYRQKDMAGWPLGEADLAAHYRAVLEFVPMAGQQDALAELFPAVPMARAAPIPASAQARALLDRLSARADALRALGVTVGRARTAVSGACTACGMCLHGCPWGHIWSATRQLDRLARHPGFTHRPGSLARSFEETGNGVRVRLAGGQALEGARLFIAAGVLETARIVLASGPLRQLQLRDSQQAFVPMLQRWRNRRRPDRMPLTTLPQIFAEIDAPEVSAHTVHAQIYTWNEYFAADLTASYAAGLALARPAFQALARRLVVAQLFAHSHHSAHMSLGLAPDGRLRVAIEDNARSAGILQRARRRLGAAMRRGGLITLGLAMRQGTPGSSFHAGASLPMSQNPRAAQSDVLGRPAGLERVHVVDASVLPAIPATTITLPVMANAHRIASAAP